METLLIDEAEKKAAPSVAENESLAPAKAGRGYACVKRCFDFAASLCGSIVLFIPMVITALLIVWKDPGNPFFAQKRVGRDGREIRILKFRSMKIGADDLEKMLTPEQMEEYVREYKLKDDPRLIGYKRPGDGRKCFGAMLRRTSIDEVPQILYNILWKGDMSLVGPRPLLVEYLPYYTEKERLRHSVRPGLTGLAQVNGRNFVAWDQRLALDCEYVSNITFVGDCKILLRTVIVTLKPETVAVCTQDVEGNLAQIRQAAMEENNAERIHVG